MFFFRNLGNLIRVKLGSSALAAAAAAAEIMSTSPAKHKSSHHHHHHHHREHHHSTSSGGTSGYTSNPIQKSTPNLASLIKIQDNSKLLPHYSVGRFSIRTLFSLHFKNYRSFKYEFSIDKSIRNLLQP